MYTALENLMHGLAGDCSWLDGETGSVDELGWFGRIDGPITADLVPAELKGEWDELSDDERDELATMAGAILKADQLGFRYVITYRDAAALASDWDAVEADYDEFYEEVSEANLADDDSDPDDDGTVDIDSDDIVVASCKLGDHELTDVPVINPGAWFGRTWLIEIGHGYSSSYFAVEADSAADAIDEFSDSEFGHLIHVADDDLDDYPEDCRSYAGNDGRVVDLDNVMLHKPAGVVYHVNGGPGIAPDMVK